MIETNARRYCDVNFQWVDGKNGLMKYGMRTNETPQRPQFYQETNDSGAPDKYCKMKTAREEEPRNVSDLFAKFLWVANEMLILLNIFHWK